MFLGVNKGKKVFIIIILVHVGILYSGKFFLTAESWEANAVVITRVPIKRLDKEKISNNINDTEILTRYTTLRITTDRTHILRMHGKGQ